MVAGLIIFVGFLTIFLGYRKYDYYVDEVWTYGLANNIGSIMPTIELGHEYSGIGPFESFVEVSPDSRFNYVNVWENQANDVHPPLYYFLVHTICSFFPGSYSKWYGLTINIIWLIFILILMYKLSKKITNNSLSSIGIVLFYGTSVLFFNTMLFIRMYAQFTFFAIAMAYLIYIYWDKELDKKFYIQYSTIVLLGMLTHYYYLIYLFGISFFYAINLFIKRQYRAIRNCVLMALADGTIYLIIWYHFAGHLFRGYRGKQAIKSAVSLGGMIDGIGGMFKIIDREVFAGTLLFFAIMLIAMIVTKIKKKELFYNYELALMLSGVFYVVVVGKIAPFIHNRYLMPVFFIFSLTGYVALRTTVIRLWKKPIAEFCLIVAFLLLNYTNLAKNDFYVQMDYHTEDRVALMQELEGKECVVNIAEAWEALYYFEPLQHAKSYVFADASTLEAVLESKKGDFIVATTKSKSDFFIEQYNAESLYVSGSACYYLMKK